MASFPIFLTSPDRPSHRPIRTMPHSYSPEPPRRSHFGCALQGCFHRREAPLANDRAYTAHPRHRHRHVLDEDNVIISFTHSTHDARPSLLTSRRPERQIRDLSNELIRERRRTDEIMQHLPAAAQMSYLAGRADGREEVRQRDHYRRQISWEDGYQAGLTAARDMSPAEYMPRNNGR